MPLEQFEHLDDYSNLSRLHIYEDLLNFYNLEMDAPLATAGRLFEELKLLDRALFTVYVVYVLGKAGFDLEERASWSEPDLTSKYTVKDWIYLCDYYRDWYADIAAQGIMSEDFVRQQSKMRITFLEIFFWEDAAALESESRLPGPPPGLTIIVVHPRTVRQVKQIFQKLRVEFKEKGGQVQLMSSGELLPMFVQDVQRRKMIEDEWETIREDILTNLIKTWPIIAIQRRRKLFNDCKEDLRRARAKYETGNLSESVRDAGLACEGILKILAEIYAPRSVTDRPEFSDLIQILRDNIEAELGEDVLKDLDYIREWRNNVSHPDRSVPGELEALKVLAKAELFMNVFEKIILPRSKSQQTPPQPPT